MPRLTDNILLNKTVLGAFLKRCQYEGSEDGGSGAYLAVIHTADNQLMHHSQVGLQMGEDEMIFTSKLLPMLNKELHHDGAWHCVFTHYRPEVIREGLKSPEIRMQFTRLALIWMDKDGDVQFPLDWVSGESEMLDFAEVLAAGIEAWGDLAENAWQQWRKFMVEVVDAKAGQTIKAAQGERGAEPRLDVELVD